MCGIAGVIALQPAPGAELHGMVRAMTATLAHRGPDDHGTWVDQDAGVALGNRRLAVIDLSADGHQPMASADSRHVVVFNGEVYNFTDLRRQLEGHGARFRGNADTEVLVEGIARWGIDSTLERVEGMFALGVWDRLERTLILARDRFGEKPLYYARFGKFLLFGSELRALRAHPDFVSAIDRDALASYLRYGCFPAPSAVYEGVCKLPVGSLLTVRPGDHLAGVPAPHRWWSARAAAERAVSDTFEGTDAEAADELQHRLRRSVALRAAADVPLGAFLSGGIDSSTVVSVLQEHSASPVHTFTIGLAEADFDESTDAAAIAKHLGTDHTSLLVTPAESMAAIERLPDVYDEPFADSSQLPTLLVSELARRDVTVVLSGDGGDEIFGGYNRHVTLERLWERVERIPGPARAALAATLRSISPGSIDRVFAALGRADPARLRLRHPGEKAHKLAALIDSATAADAYRGLVSAWPNPDAVVIGGKEPAREPLADPVSWSGLRNLTEQIMCLDTLTYLPDDQLTKLDRASMSVGLETRVPFLDVELFKFAWALPPRYKVRNGQGKWLLRQVLGRYVPTALWDRPKSGFAVPVGEWLRRPLRPWAEDLLSTRRLAEGGLLNPQPVRNAWAEHLSGRFDRSSRLWAVLMFEAWRERAGVPVT